MGSSPIVSTEGNPLKPSSLGARLRLILWAECATAAHAAGLKGRLISAASIPLGASGSSEHVGATLERTVKTLEGLLQLYETWGKPDKAAEYRTMLPAKDRD
ncbi:MAG: hypothetical protein JSU86_02605 [Phycisphaerales bacterium]|nr:MAG: hypothetical protein JSU86_02605 [Phycisphaerales bacterium]